MYPKIGHGFIGNLLIIELIVYLRYT